MKNGRGKRLFAGVLCAVMMLVLLPAQEAKALKRGDLCPYCKTGRISAVMSTSSQHALRCTSELCEYHYESKWIWESHAINGKSCGISGTCDICGLYARIPHTGGVDVCIMQGVCTRCGESYGPLGHDFSINVDAKEPTCTEIGYTAHKKCSRCSAWNEAYEEIPALDHAMVHHDALAPTCTEVGWEAYDACSRGDYSTYKEIPSLGHDLKKTDKVEPTCIKDGTEAYWVCQRDGCGKLFSDEKGEHVIDKPVVIKALNHDLVHHEAKAPTCTEVGWEAYDACSRGDYSTYKDIPSLGHDLSHHAAQAATCTEIGWDAYDTCSRCDYTTYVEKAKLGHDIVHHDAKAPTCTEVGWDAYDTCSRCDYSTYAEKASLGHDLETVAGAEPECAKPGTEAYWVCRRDGCGKLFSDAEGKNAITEPAVIPAKGHTPAAAVKENEKAARVGEAGSYDEVVYCAACGEELSRKTVETDPLPEPKQEEAEPLVSVFDETGAVKLRFFEGGTFTVRIGNKWITYGIYFLEEGVLTLELENVKMPVQEDGSLNFILGEENYLFLFPEEALTILFSAAKK